MPWKNPISPAEQNLLENALETLFACQGKNLNKEMRGIWINEIDKSTLPVKAVLQGLAFLKTEDLQTIKLNTVFGAARRFIEAEEVKGCGECSDGYVSMRDAEGKTFGLRCQCAAGYQKPRGLVSWNGEPTQFVSGRLLTK